MSHVQFEYTSPRLEGEVIVPGDKSISHRSIIFGSISHGITKISNFLDGEDCHRTIDAFREMGVQIEKEGSSVLVHGNGLEGLKKPAGAFDFGNSGTTTRLMLGLLSGLPFETKIFGDASLTKRPMDRVVTPLREMGAAIHGQEDGKYLPITVHGGALKGITYRLPVKSAQVKSAVLLAGLVAEGETVVQEDTETRNHTEVMLQAFGADLKQKEEGIVVTNKGKLTACDVEVPGDISSAAFFLAAGAIVPGSTVTLKNVGLNASRTGILDVVKQMGAAITVSNERTTGGEKIGDLTIKYTALKGTTVEGEVIPRLIDEIPILALLATQAEGKTVIKDAEELKVKETDRIEAVCQNLTTLGANITPTEDGMIIEGPTRLTGGTISSYMDHRIAMMGVIAALVSESPVKMDEKDSINISYPTFFDDLEAILQ
ncbi:3-phosphoshikimate 1-carboxyvinyltransferase [Oceanobacillus oncorhynchi subsp. incaldanensis]|uniref:3-phosphoshikimate 1-carboxyvinyltransferase n=1 Tax=Oceanobacillus TaxID=182709 RepID=UPI001866A253|nr:3-phosphoshikimate 1-carboxyvinyltransferase [Oceanobacillus oncorhynchi]UUI38089.1 3-phosphoshikimate 1-carboxyvinyltransferase [Oceanobacillus oncorhynchi]GIO17208.1 3-phosphoshikimate 1-carboxyvinyltransferase [Oceanobacillus oncorhynchi subsp. incaldanensis]